MINIHPSKSQILRNSKNSDEKITMAAYGIIRTTLAELPRQKFNIP